MLNIEQISNIFIHFGEKECRDSSQLYTYLSSQIAMDKEILELCTNARTTQPIPNLLFGAVHYLLLNGSDHPLKLYYPSITNNPLPYDTSFHAFKDFCIENNDSITILLQTRIVQTNEVRRSAFLYPAFCLVYQLCRKPIAFIEIGTSAGLQLLWDQYSYSYENMDGLFGNIESELHITSLIKGDVMPDISLEPPPVTERIGLDLHIVNVKNKDEISWLEALIWPEHKDRVTLFQKATSWVTDASLRLVEGDGIALLQSHIQEIPEDQAVCVFHTHVANQMPKEERETLLQKIEEIGKTREIYHVYNNIYDQYLHLDYYKNESYHSHILAETEGHGRWFTWLYQT